jgi:hypothetical protein
VTTSGRFGRGGAIAPRGARALGRGGGALGLGVEGIDADARIARVGLAHGAGEALGHGSGDLEGRGRLADANGADLEALDAAAPTDEREQPARIGPVALAPVDAEGDEAAEASSSAFGAAAGRRDGARRGGGARRRRG